MKGTDFIQHCLDTELPTPVITPWLLPMRERALMRMAHLGWPTRKTEAFKYSSLQSLLRDQALLQSGIQQQTVESDESPAVKQAQYAPQILAPVTDAIHLVSIDGVFQPHLSDLSRLPEGVVFCRWSQASEKQSHWLSSLLALFAEQGHFLSALQQLGAEDGWYLYVPPGLCIRQPLYWVSITTQGATGHHNLNVALHLDTGSALTVVDHHLGHIAPACITQNRFLAVVEEAAQLSQVILSSDKGAQRVANIYDIELKRQSKLEAFAWALGAEFKRLDYRVRHCGQGAESWFKGAYLCKDQQHLDWQSCFEHEVPGTRSDQVTRGMATDSGQVILGGRIHIHPKAQKTSAALSNKNLLLGAKAQINTKPELEIYADDVLCSHGATVSQLDTHALNYLRSRGVSLHQARLMLSYGFVRSLFDDLPVRSLESYMNAQINDWFGASR